jgi:GTPase Era involved in 16S rRNA processing
MSDLESLLDLADLAVARCLHVVPEQSRVDVARVVRRSRHRLGHLGEVLVVAFAGGTGSGKSSLLNAVLGEEVSQVGVARPTTDDALAVIPEGSASRFGRLLSELGVKEQITASKLKASVLVDLPDFDSTTEAHRHIVEDVLPRVDAVVWIFDPEKYADRVIHTEFLAGTVPYQSQFIFVLNQVDRLGDEATLVAADLTRMLEETGFDNPQVVTTVASGTETEVAQLVAALTGRLALKRTAMTKLVTDLRIAANDGWREIAETAITDRPDDINEDMLGLAAATFVSLGVEAAEVLFRVEER